MRAVVVYESMYGNTHAIANAIGDELKSVADVAVVPVDGADAALAAETDLLVVGGPTHGHGMTRASTRQAAVAAAKKPFVTVDPDAEGTGLRDWFDTVEGLDMRAAAFDTRFDAPPVLTGRASKGIAKRLRDHGCELIAEPESFLVTKGDQLEPGEEAHARRWAAGLVKLLDPNAAQTR